MHRLGKKDQQSPNGQKRREETPEKKIAHYSLIAYHDKALPEGQVICTNHWMPKLPKKTCLQDLLEQVVSWKMKLIKLIPLYSNHILARIKDVSTKAIDQIEYAD